MDFKIGDKVEVQYLTSTWLDVEIVAIKSITKAQVDDARKYYPNLQEGDPILVCGSGGDNRSFLPGHDKVRRPGDTEPYVLPRLRPAPPAPPPPPFEAKVSTGEDIRPLHKIKLKNPRP